MIVETDERTKVLRSVMVLQSQCLCHRSNKSGSVRLLYSLISNHQNSQLTNHQPTIASDRRSRRLNRKTTDLHTAVLALYARSIWPTSQTGGQPWMPTLTKTCDIQTGPRPCGGWTNPAGTGLSIQDSVFAGCRTGVVISRSQRQRSCSTSSPVSTGMGLHQYRAHKAQSLAQFLLVDCFVFFLLLLSGKCVFYGNISTAFYVNYYFNFF